MVQTQVNADKTSRTTHAFLWEQRTGLGKVSLPTSGVFPV